MDMKKAELHRVSDVAATDALLVTAKVLQLEKSPQQYPKLRQEGRV